MNHSITYYVGPFLQKEKWNENEVWSWYKCSIRRMKSTLTFHIHLVFSSNSNVPTHSVQGTVVNSGGPTEWNQIYFAHFSKQQNLAPYTYM